MKRVKSFIIHFVIIVVMMSAVVGIAKKMDDIRPNQELQEFLYLAKNNQIKSFAFGFEAEYADILWMLSIQAFRQYAIEKTPFPEVKQVYKSIAKLDPHFQGMYETACIYINMVEKRPLPGVQFIEESLQQEKSIGAKYPESEKLSGQPWMWYLLGRIYCLQRLELQNKEMIFVKDTMRKAMACMNKCLQLSDGKHMGAQFFAYFLVRLDEGFSFDLVTWLQIYSSAGDNEVLQNLILKTIRELIAEAHLDTIHKKFSEYHKTHGSYPTKLSQCMHFVPLEPREEDMRKITGELLNLVMSSLQKSMTAEQMEQAIFRFIHQDMPKKFPNGQQYIIQLNRVLSPSIEQKRLEKQVRGIQIMVERFKKKFGRFPNNLQEIVNKSGLDEIKPLPLGKKYTYDAKTGEVGSSE
ncbi:hypothetical protein [Candidatus Uabimicrobium amorphum]|uniref:Uncharacterized protein n=1 Tax=Uabimicrobium amorphum TaxID=2596890 RepID=A0A5S9F7A8_UABAM|nr:hypothetical protein [Candidatus Uabimicrobium amorphum]BBM88171.1 hypothetical protein UABAM_06588 [Candidatus Uabimicrobium amorphum]